VTIIHGNRQDKVTSNLIINILLNRFIAWACRNSQTRLQRHIRTPGFLDEKTKIIHEREFRNIRTEINRKNNWNLIIDHIPLRLRESVVHVDAENKAQDDRRVLPVRIRMVDVWRRRRTYNELKRPQ
jgi:hypothetical protein